MLSVRRLSVQARLDDSTNALTEAQAQAAAGDESWEQWVIEYQRGDALIVSLELAIELANAEPRVIRGSCGGLFVENSLHAPKVEQQIAEVASDGFVQLIAELSARGHDIAAYELDGMYVHVELGPELRRQLAAFAGAA